VEGNMGINCTRPLSHHIIPSLCRLRILIKSKIHLSSVFLLQRVWQRSNAVGESEN
jgi:hypothetical protein